MKTFFLKIDSLKIHAVQGSKPFLMEAYKISTTMKKWRS
ncbi:MAG: hypothetical protein ACD_28C00076G0006 [uncultured bacterium]|nr:MAG: hypothetical protein ACD_28C00076G0006 [uncultured bacterium]KKT75835.1 MAG: hypothetical protein UW70_C0027G0021 [Candidatus Peregrinibacteria bacterium GW2011_GWA2_44_7]